MNKLDVIKYNHNFLLLLAEEYNGKMTWKEISILLFDEATQYQTLFLKSIKELKIANKDIADYDYVYKKSLELAPITYIDDEDEEHFLIVDEERFKVNKKSRLQTSLNKVGLKLIEG